jgi:hypothetical protein
MLGANHCRTTARQLEESGVAPAGRLGRVKTFSSASRTLGRTVLDISARQQLAQTLAVE